MATGRIRRSSQRGVAAAVLGWLGVATVSVLLAPSASAAPSVTVAIRDLTPPVASVDAGGTVTFVNQIQDKTVQVGGNGLVPTLVNVTAKTDVTLTLPSGSKPLPAGAQVTEKFASTCATCRITYTYRLQGGTSLTQPLTDQALGKLPPLPAPTPFVVNTIAPVVPNVPGVNVPQVPQLTVPTPKPPVTPPPPPPGSDGGPEQAPDDPGTTTGGPVGPTGDQYAYDIGADTPRLAAVDAVAAAAFDPSRFFVPGQSLGSADRGGSGGLAGSYDGASVPVFGELAGLDGRALDENEAEEASASRSSADALPVAALVAVVALAAVTAALVRTHQAQRAAR